VTRFREKVALLDRYGLDLVLCFKFNEQTRAMTADRFIHMLVDDLAVRGLCVGDDFRFGQDRSGDFEALVQAGREFGFTVFNLYTLVYEQARVSSTRIRECLASGDFTYAEKLLGYPYSITGKVVYGRQLGHSPGTPTANIQLHRYVAPLAGVFACEVEVGEMIYQGVANVGVRPTIDDSTVKPILEVHLFDFEGDLYGRNVKVIFRHRIREEKKFDDMEALKAAIRSDIDEARRLFREVS